MASKLIAGEFFVNKDGVKRKIPAAALSTPDLEVPPPVGTLDTLKTLEKARQAKDDPEKQAEILKNILSTARPKRSCKDDPNTNITPQKLLGSQDFYWVKIRQDAAYCHVLREWCLSSFMIFCQMSFRYVYRKRFVWSDHHTTMYRELLEVYLGLNQNLVINIAPRYGKTEFMCLFVAWTFLHNPLCEWLHLSYSDALACRNSDKIKDIVKSQWYSDLFGGLVSIDPKKDSKTEWHLKQGGVFYAVSSGGQVTGFGAGSSEEVDEFGKYTFSGGIWIDDPLKPDDAHTIRRDQINERWTEVIKSRRNSPKTTPTICIMQRIHEGDFTAELLSDTSEKFRLLKMKTLKDDNTALWPLKHSVKQLKEMQAQNNYVFSSQYQQEPTPVGGSIFKAEWWKEYTDRPAFEAVIVTADTAQKTGQHNDYSVFQAWGLHASAIYLINQLRGKWESPDLIKQATAFLNDTGDTYRIRAMYIEDKVSGTGLIQTLPSLTNVPVIALQRNKDKVTRSFDAAPYVQQGRVWLPKGSGITGIFKAEATSFSPEMTHLHDDQIDAFMDAAEILLAQNQKTTVIHDVLQSCVF
jgi:predicted phage terminase large subunit-like protein